MRPPRFNIDQALRRRSASVSYALALACVLLALGVRLAAWSVLETEAPFLFFIGALVVAAWYGGLGPGLVATFVSAIVADYYLLPPLHTIGPRTLSQTVWLISFCLIGLLISWLMQNLKSITVKAAESAREVLKSEAELRTILETLPVGVWLTDKAGRITFTNPADQRTWARACVGSDPYAGYKASWLETGEQMGPTDSPVARALRGQTQINTAVRIESSDGVQKTLLSSAVPVNASDGTILGAVVVNEDITERQQAAELIERQQRLLDTIFDNILAAVAYLDRDFNFVRVNSVYAQSSGYSAAELLGRNHFDLFPDAENRAIFERVRDTGETYVARAREFRYAPQSEHPETFWDWWLCALPSTQGGTEGIVLSLVEVTETERARRRVERLNLELRDASRRKDEFLAMLSHELRNPLAAILNAVTVLKRCGPDEPVLNHARDAAERQVRHMARLLDDLLDVSRVTMGKITLKKERVNLASAVQRSAEVIRPQVEKRGLHMAVMLSPEHLVVDADPERLEQVINNLLSNAAKFTLAGGHITVTVSMAGEQALVRVKDDGIGIPQDLQPHIFDLFVQGERPIDRSQGGLGVGLTLVRRILELHNGSIEVRSRGCGMGSEFTVRLPIAARGPGKATETVPKAPRSRRRILLIEDNADSADMLRLLLESEGHSVRVARDGLCGMTIAMENDPEVAIIDIGLPGMTGYEVARRMRANPLLRAMRLIALTGYGQDEDIRKAREAGFDEHVTKPADLQALCRAVYG
jgi:PAS domain S-box-containing protein